jgi:hypothetical protein
LQPGIVRDQRQHVPSTGRAGEQTNHSRAIEASHPVRADIGPAGLADRLSVEHHGERRFPGRSWVHDQVDLTRSEGKHDPAGAVLKLDVRREPRQLPSSLTVPGSRRAAPT